jgi:transforming growth factor-beta-induced protein
LVDGAMATTLQGQRVTFMLEGGSIMVNDGTVVMADMLAFNGVTHGIDRILIPGTVVDIALQTESLSTLVTAVTAADLVDALNDPEISVTVLAPDNDALGTLATGLLDMLLTPGFKKHLQEILLYHVYAGGAVLSSAFAATQEVEMLNGELLTVNKTDTAVTVTTTRGQTATVIMADLDGSNGVVHIIDGVLVPSSIGATVIDLGASYSTLLSLITIVGLEEALSGGPFTLFAPTNTAFAALDSATVDFLTSDAGAGDLASILTYHVVSGSVTSDLLVDGAMATTLQGQRVTFMLEGESIMVNDGTVVMADMLAFNGVTHGIDRILIPGTVVDIALQTESLSTLVTAVTAADLVDALNDPEISVTVLAPDNDALGTLATGLLDMLLTPGFKKHLQEILLYHVYAGGAVLSSAFAATQEVEMLNGEMITVNKTDTAVTVTTTRGQTATVIMADLEGSNGVVHIINDLLAPSSIGATVIDLGASYSTLLSVITIVGLEEALSGGPFTLFAPTNTAFEALDDDTVTLLTSADGAQMLISILAYHVINGSVTSDLVMDRATATTEQGGQVTFRVGESIMVNDATIIDPDMLALNGVAHGIDRLLMPPWVTIVDLAVATKSLSTLVTAVTAAGFVDALSDPLAFLTVLAPDNDAFDALPAGLLTALLTPGFKKHLQEILLYHVYAGGAFLSSALAATQEVEMLNGEILTVTKTETEFSVITRGQTAMVTMADLEGSNGVMHIIDGVLVPSSIGATVIDLIANYSTLLSLITRAGLEATLAGGPFTLFAPTNTAFEVLDADIVAYLTSDAGAGDLASFLTYHVVRGSVTSDLVMNEMMVATVQGDIITFMLEGESVMVNDATVVMADMLAFNGVTHGIDKVLMPPDSMAPTMAPATSGALAVGASLSALFAAVLTVAL